MLEKFFSQIKTILLYTVLGIVIIAVCIGSALYALRVESQPEQLLKQTLKAHDFTATISTPFEMTEDAGFSVEPEIRYYVKSTKAYYGSNEELSLHVYSVTYKTELFKDSWAPNIDNMADVSINTLKKNKLLRNLQSEKQNIRIAGFNAVMVTVIYKKGQDNMVQKTIHIPTRTSTWSFKTTYKDNKKMVQTVSEIFDSITLAGDV